MQEREPQKEQNQRNCNYCGPGWPAVWDVVTDEGEVFVCDNHHFVLRQIHVVGLERKVGEEEWTEVPDFMNQNFEEEYVDDFGDWKDMIDFDDL